MGRYFLGHVSPGSPDHGWAQRHVQRFEDEHDINYDGKLSRLETYHWIKSWKTEQHDNSDHETRHLMYSVDFNQVFFIVSIFIVIVFLLNRFSLLLLLFPPQKISPSMTENISEVLKKSIQNFRI